MGVPSVEASYSLIYITYGAFLAIGLFIAWRLRHQSKTEFLSSNRTQKAIPLAFNFIASALGSGILFTYPQIATICGVQGLVIYALSSSLPLLLFGLLGPIIRRKCPEGFVLTEWTRQRYGAVASLLLSLATLITLFLYMVAELSALQQIVSALTGLDGLPPVVVQCVVTTIYTSLGGFKVSFITDNIQGAMVVGLIIIGVITVGVNTDVDPVLVESSGLLEPSLLGWQLLYILPVAIFTNVFFISWALLRALNPFTTLSNALTTLSQGFWLRTFASRTDTDLRIGTGIATVAVGIILAFVGSVGLLAAWSGAWPGDPPQDGAISFFLLLGQLPAWVVGIVLVMVVSLSTAAFDSFQSAMVSNGSNDLFRNRLNIWFIRASVVLLIVPVVVVALKSPDILTIYLISDLVSASLVPVLVIGLSDRCYWWRGFEVVVGALGGLFSVFLFGTVYYGDAGRGARLLLLEGGLYADDWSAFGAFVAAPVGALLWALAAFVLRITFLYIKAKVSGHRFDAFDRPIPADPGRFAGSDGLSVGTGDEERDSVVRTSRRTEAGKFF